MGHALTVKPSALWLVLIACAACGPQTYVVQSYDGPVRSSETIAILRINGGDSVQVVTLDGEYADPRLASDTRLHIELLPGKHVVGAATAVVSEYGGPSRILRRLPFRAEAGRVYRVAFAAGAADPSAEPRVLEVDRGSDRPLRDVTLALPAPGAAAPERVLPPPAPIVAPPPSDSNTPDGPPTSPAPVTLPSEAPAAPPPPNPATPPVP